MPKPHATPAAMPRGQYYVRTDRGGRKSGAFRTGPYPSKEDAIDEGPQALKLEPGEKFEVGLLVPFTPRIDVQEWLVALCQSALQGCGQEVADGWVHTLSTIPAEPLEEAMNLLLKGWLSANEAHPNFGMIAEATTHTVPKP